jgi:hypothetical protein
MMSRSPSHVAHCILKRALLLDERRWYCGFSIRELAGSKRSCQSTHLSLLCLQHFTGTMDNWDPAVTDLFENAGVGRSSGSVPTTMAGMAAHALAFLDGLGIKACDVLGFSLGGMVAQQVALVGTAEGRKNAGHQDRWRQAGSGGVGRHRKLTPCDMKN